MTKTTLVHGLEVERFRPKQPPWPDGVVAETHRTFWFNDGKRRIRIHPGDFVTEDVDGKKSVMSQEELRDYKEVP